MSPLHFNLLFILIFSATARAIQERAIGTFLHYLTRFVLAVILSLLSPGNLESCGLFYTQYSQKLMMEPEADIMGDFEKAALEGRIGGEKVCAVSRLWSHISSQVGF